MNDWRERQEYHQFQDGHYDDDLDEWVEGNDDAMPWRNAKNLRGRWVGIEFEVENEDGWAVIAKALPDVLAWETPPALEEDATIDPYRGLEIIFPPVKLSDFRDPNLYFNRAMAKLRRTKGMQYKGNHGMHFNVNTRGWSTKKKGVFMMSILGMPEDTMVKLGGRELTNFCGEYYSELQYEDDNNPANSMAAELEYYAEEPSGLHDYAAEWRTGAPACEIRFFKATTSQTVIDRALVWIEALQDYATLASRRPKQFVSRLDVYIKFHEWLTNHDNGDYRALAKYLA